MEARIARRGQIILNWYHKEGPACVHHLTQPNFIIASSSGGLNAARIHVARKLRAPPSCSRSALHLLPLSSKASRSGSLPSFSSSSFHPPFLRVHPLPSAMFAPLLDRRSFSVRPRRHLALLQPRIGHRECHTAVSSLFLFGWSNWKIID